MVHEDTEGLFNKHFYLLQINKLHHIIIIIIIIMINKENRYV